MKKLLPVHGCWAIAALIAFGLGARRDGPPTTGSAEDADSPRNSLNSRRSADSGADGGPGSAASRRAAKRESSQLARVFGAIVATGGDLDALIEQALRDPNPITRRLAFSRLLESLTPENAGTIRAQLVALGADADQWRDFHYSWGAIAGKVAIDHAANSPERDLNATMTGWAAANPAEALALLDNLPPEMQGQRDGLAASVVSGLAHTDRALATDLVLRLGQQGDGQAGSLMEIVTGEALRAEGPEAASRWSESLPDGPLKGTAMSKIAEAYVRKDPVAAARWAESFAGKDYAARVVEQIGGQWAQSDPVTAVGWLESLPAGSGQKAGLRNAFGDWEDRDPDLAAKYLLGMAVSEQRDAAISGYATGYAWQNPQVAIAWAQDIRDPALRQSSLTRAGQAFYQRDPNGALAWLESSNLPEEARQQILNNRR